MNFLPIEKHRHIPRILGLGLFLQQLDSMILNTSIPQMAGSLGTSALDLKLAITSYLLTLAIFIPISGYVADRYGTRRTFFLALIIFLLGSVICGLAFNIDILILGRLVQGAGAAFITPVGRLILLKTFSKADFLHAFALYVVIGQLGTMVGPILGGVITTFTDWRLIFFVNIPVVLIALYLTRQKLPNYDDRENLAPLDWAGFILFGLAVGMVTFGLSWLTEENFKDPRSWILSGLGVSLLVVYYFYARRVPSPLVDLKVFRFRTFRVTMMGGFWFRLASSGVSFLLPLQLQLEYGYSAFFAGLLLFPNALGFLGGRFLFHRLLGRYGFKRILVVMPLILALGLFGLSWMSAESVIGIMTACMVMLGVFSSLQYAALNTLTFADIPDSETSKATSVSTVLQQVGLSLAVCFSAGLLLGMGDLLGQSAISGKVFQMTYLILGGMTALSAISFLGLSQADGQKLLKKEL